MKKPRTDVPSRGRRQFLASGAAVAAGASLHPALPGAPAVAEAASVAPFEHDEATVADLQAKMSSGELSSRRLTEAYLARIEALDRTGPALRSVIETNPEALAIAEALDTERSEKGSRGVLHGIPVLLKDNVGTADRMTTTAGSLALEGSIPKRDSHVAELLREAGAVLLGKANLSEWANFRSTRSNSGWSARGGQCRNPYALDRNPCGSSSGSGAAVAASLCAVAVGTETDGSIVCPSSRCGIVGIKPTLGLVSRDGIIPLAHSQDTAGPMARTVADAAALLGALAGRDPRDPATSMIGHAERDYTRFLDRSGLDDARIGVARNLAGFDPRVDTLFEEAIREMRRLGAEVIDPADIPHTDELGKPEFEVLLYEFKADIGAYLAALSMAEAPRTLADLIAFNEANKEREMPLFGQELFLQAQEKGPLTSPEYKSALDTCRRLSRAEGLDKVLEDQSLDAVIAPSGGPAWLTDPVNGDYFTGGDSTPAAVSGYPSLTVPMGYVAGLPVGLTFVGRPWSEGGLIRRAYAFEQATRHRRAPRFLPTVDM